MSVVSKKFSTNVHLVKDALTKYPNTFVAINELITNAVQAKASLIKIDFVERPASEGDLGTAIDHIVIEDNGHGVALSEFDSTILDIGTDSKEGGLGIGRFAAFQIGRNMMIETTAYDSQLNKYTRTCAAVDISAFESRNINDYNVELNYLESDNELPHCYKVTIKGLFNNDGECPKKNKLTEDFQTLNFKQRLFESYPYEVFEELVHFQLNNEIIRREEFVIGTPVIEKVPYKDIQGKDHELCFTFYNVSLPTKDINLFIQVDNAGVKTSIAKYGYGSKWHTADLGTWYVFLNSEFITRDMHSDFDIADLGAKESQRLIAAIKDTLDCFFKKRNTKYKTFVEKLVADKSYPFENSEVDKTLGIKETVFRKTAYIIEDEHKLIESSNEARSVIYPLLNKVIEDGNTRFVLDKVVNLSEDNRQKLYNLLNKTDLEEVIKFSSNVAEKMRFLDFLHELTYGSLSKSLKERSQLHKIVEKQLWIFGEGYNGTPHLWSDKKLANNLNELHIKHFGYEPTQEDENLIEEYKESCKDITDLFFYNDKRLVDGRKEVMIVELKAPSCAIADKEISQAKRYAYDIEIGSEYPKEKVAYKILLISSRFSNRAKSEIMSQQKVHKEYGLIEHKTANDEDIKVYAMTWSELIEQNRLSLSYMGDTLKLMDEDANTIFETEYPELLSDKAKARLAPKKLME